MLLRWLDSDVGHSFRTSPTAIVAAVIAFICVFCAVFAPWVAPHNPFDLATLELSDARLPPVWQEGGKTSYLLGTDDQGRDILSALMFGARISLMVGLASVLLSVALTLWVSPLFYWFTLFIGANLIQSAFTGFCPAASAFKWFGIRKGCAFE